MDLESYYTKLLVHAATIAPCDYLVNKLEESIREYRKATYNSSEQDKYKALDGALSGTLMLIMIKITGENPDKLIKRLEELSRADKLIHPSNQ